MRASRGCRGRNWFRSYRCSTLTPSPPTDWDFQNFWKFEVWPFLDESTLIKTMLWACTYMHYYWGIFLQIYPRWGASGLCSAGKLYERYHWLELPKGVRHHSLPGGRSRSIFRMPGRKSRWWHVHALWRHRGHKTSYPKRCACFMYILNCCISCNCKSKNNRIHAVKIKVK